MLNAIAGGWQLGSILTWRSGFPVNPTTSTPIVPMPPASAKTSPTAPRRNGSISPLYSFGNAGRNSVIGPPGFSLDFSANKSFPPALGRSQRAVPLRAFNLLNHPIWGLPVANHAKDPVRDVTRLKGLCWWMITLIMLGSVINYLTRRTLAVAASTVLKELNIGAKELSWMVGAFQGAIMA